MKFSQSGNAEENRKKGKRYKISLKTKKASQLGHLQKAFWNITVFLVLIY